MSVIIIILITYELIAYFFDLWSIINVIQNNWMTKNFRFFSWSNLNSIRTHLFIGKQYKRFINQTFNKISEIFEMKISNSYLPHIQMFNLNQKLSIFKLNIIVQVILFNKKGLCLLIRTFYRNILRNIHITLIKENNFIMNEY